MDSAWDIRAEKKVYGEELWALEVVDAKGYRCWGCAIPLYPASYVREEKIQRPHFRLYPKTLHVKGCDADAEAVLIGEGKKKSVREHLEKAPGLSPARLSLIEQRTHRDDESLSPLENSTAASAETRSRDVNDREAKGTSRRPANTLRPICKAFMNFPYDRNMSLQVPSVAGDSYLSVFKNIPRNHLKVLPTTQIFYSALSWSKLSIGEDQLTIKLAPHTWEDKKPTGHYQLNVDWKDWAKRTKTMLSNELDAARLEAIKAKGTSAVAWVFFLGNQDEANPEIFHVSDHRLICVLVGEIQVSFAGSS